MDTVISNNGK
ncbi:hypothetical protein CAJAP_02840 [Camponotus japonicus]